MKLLSALSLLMMSAMASAQTQSVDPTLFQTTSFIRLQNGDFETVSAQTKSFFRLDPITSRQIVDPLTGQAEIESSQAYIYDARNPFTKMVAGGANYAVLADKNVVTFSSTWEKPLPAGKLFFEVDTYGGNFFIKRGTREIVTVTSMGIVSSKSNGEWGTTVIAPAIRLVGGNWFIDVNNELWTVDHKGFVTHFTETKYPLAYLPGGNYFYQQDGTIVSIASNGRTLGPNRFAKPKILGGNYYVGEDGVMYSFRYDGVSFKNERVPGRVRSAGYSYVLFDNGAFAIIDGMGKVYTDAVRVSSTKNSFKKIETFRDAIDPVSIWTPNTTRRN